MRDHGCQPTARAFMAACRILGSQQAFTRDNTPKGKADTERVRRPIQEECLWLQEWSCLCALVRALGRWITYDNAHDRHASLGDKPPRPFEHESYSRHSTPFAAA
jgi:putative transposase